MRRFLAIFPFLLFACERAAPTSSSTPATSTSEPSNASSAPPASAAVVLGPKDAKFMEDLNSFCIITQQVKGDSSIPEDQRAKEIVGRLIASKPGPDFLVLLRSLSSESSGEHRYKALKRAASERGATQWACPALMD